nr:hypothetical protein [Tanacetum cinerariifolium]
MALTFAVTHNMIAFLTKSDANEGFNPIIDFFNASSIKKKVIITKATIRDALRLDDAEGIECLPNEEIFTELARIGYEKPSTKLTFYKAFFSSQWKFLIHTILQCMSAKRTSWNEFSSSMAYVVICLSTGKGCSGVETPLFEGMIVAQQVGEGAAEVNVEDVSTGGVAAKGAASATDDELPAAVDKPSIPSPPPSAQPPLTSQDIPLPSQGRIIADMDVDKDVTLKDVAAVAKDVQDAEIEERLDSQPSFKMFNSNVAFLQKTKKQMDEEDSRALKRLSESQEDIAAKNQKLDSAK